ncbi:HAD-like protein [Coniochaeta hoffmannii]|uniref:Mitochondrial import inner membrane translocase subunit TIM50 n=1 Tax=Coniochaeta hoffmannii TaxID=91930 RepID=A0AA38VQC2_9PEZI|nr:HAD-like protein [Coniochaeta hoffmannii]
MDYVASYWQQQQQHQQAVLQQQVHHGALHPTPTNLNNQAHQLQRNAPIAVQGFHPPTQPPTNPPSGPGSEPKSKPKPKRKPSPKPKYHRQDAIIPPSPASGGVPDPSPPYLLRSSFLARPLPSPQPLLVIIDLNGTLVHRPNPRHPRDIVPRPFAPQFLSYCLDTFHVMIWSSARPANVAAMCEKLLTPDQLARVVAVWGRDRFGLSPQDYNCRVQCYKRLSKVWADRTVQATYPPDYDDAGMRIDDDDDDEDEAVGGDRRRRRRRRPGSWNQGNTVLIDDSREKARSEPYNAIEIPEFSGVEKEEVLPRVHDYLNTLACQADVSTYIRVNPFKALDKQAEKGV